MKIVVFGATGGTGRAAVEQAIARGHVVTAVARKPDAFPLRHAPLTVARSDVTDAGTLTEPMRGADAVLSTIGVVKNEETTVHSVGTAHILNAMRAGKVKRFLGVTSVGVEAEDPSFNVLYGTIARRFFINHIYADMRRMESLVRAASDIEWTLVRPGRLTDDPGRGSYRTSTGKLPPTRRGGVIARADLAHLMLESLEDKRYVRQHVAVTY